MEGVLEGLLFVQGDDGLTLKEVMSILNLSEDEAKELVYKLKSSYECDNRGLRLSYLGNTFKLTTKQEHKQYYEKLIESPTTHTLSQAALETLAIIAYYQPATTAYISRIRGVDSSYSVSSLVEKGLIESKGRLEAPGRPTLYGTTDLFLRTMQLSDLSDLPKLPEIASTEGIQKLQQAIDDLQEKDK